MNPNQAVSPEDQNVVGFSESPGRRLRVQRQSRGLEVERVATQLHLRRPMIEALEADRYEDLPGPVFIVGYLRNYARLLGMDAEPLIDAYRAAAPQQEPPAPRHPPRPGPQVSSRHILVRLVTVAMVIAVIGLILLWWQNRAEVLSSGAPIGQPGELLLTPEATDKAQGDDAPGDTPDEDGAADLQVPAQAPDVTPPADLPAPSLGAAAASLTLPAPATPSPSALPSTQPATSTPPPTDTAPDTAPPSREVALSFTGPCWIDVRDASGKAVLSGEMRKGDSRTLDGTPPFSFVVGNVAATRITVGGTPFDLTDKTRGGVARFTLDPNDAG